MASERNISMIILAAASSLALTACGASGMKSVVTAPGAVTDTPSAPAANVDNRVTPASLVIPQENFVVVQPQEVVAAPSAVSSNGTSLEDETSVCELVFYNGAKAVSKVWPAQRERCLTSFFELGRVNGGLLSVNLNIIEAGIASAVSWKSISIANENPLGFSCALNDQNIVAGSPTVRAVTLSSNGSAQAAAHCAEFCRRSNEELGTHYSSCSVRKYLSPNGIVTLQDEQNQINF